MDNHYPALYRSANELSLGGQRYFIGFLFLNLLSLVVASILSVFNIPIREIAYSQTFVLFISLGCTIYLGAVRPEKRWYGGRALAESIKTVTWRYMMKAEPYNVSDVDARSKFIDVLKNLIENSREVQKMAMSTADGIQITDFMDSMRSNSFNERKEFYKNQRVTEQLSWYAKNARGNQKKAGLFFWILCSVNIMAIGFSIVKIQIPTNEFWPTDIFVSLAGSLLAWMQAKRYQELSSSYALAAHEISLIREKLYVVNDDKTFSFFVSDSENAFSREHTQWFARRDT